MNLSRWGIRHPAAACVFFAVLVIAGLFALGKLPISTLPNFALPEITVNVGLPGATPAQMETDVTRKIEDAVSGLANIHKLTSSISDGSSNTRIEFELDQDLNVAIEAVRDAIDRIRTDLPSDIDEPVISRVNTIGAPLLSYALVTDSMALDELSWFVDDVVRKALFDVPGVAQVRRAGGVEREVRIELQPEALQSLDLTASTVSAQLARLQVELPGGRTSLGGGEQAVRTQATVSSAADLADYPMSLPDGRSVRLATFATVTDGSAEPREVALLNGRPVVGISIQRATGTSEVGVGRAIRERIARLSKDHPGIRFVEISSSVEAAEASYDASIGMLLEGSVLAVLVVWLFLRDWRATWISALALPLSVIPTFLVMQVFGFSLNLLSLLAFAVIIGILVDDAIVEVENIARHRAMGKSPLQAAIDAADEIGIAVIATSVTVAAVFLPVAFMPREIGQFFREFGWTAAAAVLFSLLVARLLTPMLAARFLRGDPPPSSTPRWMDHYLALVRLALSHRGRTMWLVLATFIASLALVPLIPTTFLPAADATRTEVQLELPPGVSLSQTMAVAEQARHLVQSIPELHSVFARVGSVPTGGYDGGVQGDVRKAALTLEFAADRKRTLRELEADVRGKLRDLPGVRMTFSAGAPGDRLDVVLAGANPVELAEAGRAIESALRSLQGLGSVFSSAALLRPEIVIVPDAARAADLGVSTVDIAQAARVGTNGDLRQRLAKLNLPERQVPIRVKIEEGALSDAELLAKLRVPAREGSVPLSAVATIREGSGPAQITRFNRERNIKVAAELNGRPLGEVMQELEATGALAKLPASVRILRGGDAEALMDMIVGFSLAMAGGIGSAYIVLMLLFRSASQPIVILGAVPLAGAGAFGALLVTGHALSLPSLIGLLTLIGIATKNSILIVDYALIGERDLGLSRTEAIIDACRKRARPVIMTTLAMGAGILPVALALGADGNFRAPLGVSIIGGLITSTFLSLVAIPAGYSLMADWTDRLRGKRPRTVPNAAVHPL